MGANSNIRFIDSIICNTELLNAIDKVRVYSKEGALIIVEIGSMEKIYSAVGFSRSKEIMDDIVADISLKIKEADFIIQAGEKYIFLCFSKRADAKNIAVDLRDIFQFFSSGKYHIHVHPIIASIKLTEFLNDTKMLVEKLFLSLKNICFNEEIYYADYEELKEDIAKTKEEFDKAFYFKNKLFAKEVKLFYQPVVDTNANAISHYECLLRIKEGDQCISAGPYIMIAEEYKFIDIVDDLVLELAVQELHNNKDIHLSFNISALSVYNDEWLEKARRLLKNSDISKRLVIELTETAAQKDLRKSIEFLGELQKLGCAIAIDDFGVGYTSFIQLRDLPVDMIKIDGSFIKDITHNKRNRVFVEALSMMNKVLHFKLVAEYVENKEISDLLTELGVYYQQGYYFAPGLEQYNFKLNK